MGLPRVLILGAGFGGLKAAYCLRKAAIELTVVDRTNHHLFQPLLYQVATSALSPRDIAYPIREILKRQSNTTVFMDEATQIDKEQRCVHFNSGRVLEYDHLIVAIGNQPSYFGHNEWETVAPGLKTLEDALDIRQRILTAFEKAEASNDPSEVERLLTFAIVGGGPTGVELSGAIAEIAHHTMLRNFRRIDPTKTKIYLIEAAPHLLMGFPEQLGQRAKEDLEKLGVKVLTQTMVQDMDGQSIRFADQTVPTHQIFWAAGNTAPKLLSSLNTPQDKHMRVQVEPDLSIPGYSELFVIGDAAYIQDTHGNPLPGVAQVAIQQGEYVAKVLANQVEKSQRKPFKYRDKGSMATIGRARAVAVIGQRLFTGIAAWLIWSLIHIAFLVGFRNRIMVMTEWLFWYLTEQRSSRLIFASSPDKVWNQHHEVADPKLTSTPDELN